MYLKGFCPGETSVEAGNVVFVSYVRERKLISTPPLWV